MRYLLRRFLLLVQMRLAALQRPDDPVQALEGLYGRQAGLLEEAQRAALEVAAARRRLEYRLRDLQQPGWRREADIVRRRIRELRADEKRLRAAMEAASKELRRVRVQVDLLETEHSVATARAGLAEARAELGDEAVALRLSIDAARASIAEASARAEALERLRAFDAL